MLNKITIDGETFDVDDFEGRELIDAEKVFGVNLLVGIDEPSMSVVYAMVWLVKRRANPGFSPDDAMKINLGDLGKMMGDPEKEEKPGPPPARAKAGAKKPPA
jgi:hypothetical protein